MQILEQCQVNQLYIIGKTEIDFESDSYFVEYLDVSDISTLKYLVGLSLKLEG